MEATICRRGERRPRSSEAPSWSVPPRVLPATPEPVRPDLPSWAELPVRRRRRLVAVLGDLVLRARSEERRDEAHREGEAHADGRGPAQ